MTTSPRQFALLRLPVIAGLAAAGLVLAPLSAGAAPNTSPAAQQGAEQTIEPVEPVIESRTQWAVALLHQGNWPVTGNNVCALASWANIEGGHFTAHGSQHNPLNTTQSAPGAWTFNSVGVKNYPTWSIGLDATLRTLSLGAYSGIRIALSNGGNALAVLSAVNASPWGTKSKNPASWLIGGCTYLGAEFDAQRGPLQDDIEKAEQANEDAEKAVSSAVAAQAAVTRKFTRMASEIDAAHAELDEFARGLYIAGADPALVSQVQVVGAGDAGEYLKSQQIAGYASDNQAESLERAVGVLTQVDAERSEAATAVEIATNANVVTLAALTNAQQKLTDLETHYFTL